MLIEPNELIVDSFAGGGGASTGIERALGRPIDLAINHDPEALALHAANHPHTKHLCEDVWDVDVLAVTAGRPVGLAWFSPDCKHFSKAKGGKPVSKNIRGLAWLAVKWAELKKPRVIALENVEEFQTWGPLLADGRPCPERRGLTFKRWVSRLRNLGYRIDWRELRACDYGAPTIRKRLFLVARCDGQPILWSEKTHGPGLLPYRTAADCIDWSIPCPSIFLSREEGRSIGVNRPLADATMRRIARGVKRYVLDTAEPFIVNMAHGGSLEAILKPVTTIATEKGGCRALVAPLLAGVGGRAGQSRPRSADEPFATLTAKADTVLVASTLIQTGYGERDGQAPRVPGLDKPLGTVVAGGGKHAVVSAFLSSYYGAKNPEGDARGSSLDGPIATQPTENRHALVAAFLAQHNGGRVGHAADEPVSTITQRGTNQALVTAFVSRQFGNSVGSEAEAPVGTVTSGGGGKSALVASHVMKMRGTNTGSATDEPLHTVSAGGLHQAEVRAFLLKYYGTDQDPQLGEPLHTVTSRDRFGLVTVQGEDYYIADIGMRMLAPRELFRAQGFGDDYIIDRGPDGRPLTKTAQVRMCGNSVCPPVAEAIVRAQFAPKTREAAA